MADASGTNSQPPGAPYVFFPLGYAQLTVGATATTFNAPTYATVAVIAIETNPIRYRDDGTAPTSTAGMPIAVGQAFQYSGNLGTFQMISQGGNATVDVLFYR